jgi:hypothetical protein
VRPDAELRTTGARFTVDVGASSIGILVTKDGSIVDDYDPSIIQQARFCPRILSLHDALFWTSFSPTRNAPPAGDWTVICSSSSGSKPMAAKPFLMRPLLNAGKLAGG